MLSKTLNWKIVILILTLLTTALVLVVHVNSKVNNDMQKKLIAYYPFTFGQSVDPTRIFTVGQQVIAEHVFAFLARRSVVKGFESSIAKVEIDSTNNVLHASLKTELITPDGETFNQNDFCLSLKTSVAGTVHSPYKSLVSDFKCDDSGATIRYKTLPVNLRYLLTLPDFALFRPKALPLTQYNISSSTGPYYPVSISNERVSLRRNKSYPAHLMGNHADEAELIAYSASDTKSLIEQLNASRDAAVYFYGYSIDDDDIKSLDKINFEVEFSPHEWLVYFKTSESTSREIKSSLSAVADRIRIMLASESLGEPTSTLAQLDAKFTEATSPLDNSVLANLTIHTLRGWAETPAFRKILGLLRELVPGLSIKLLEREQLSDLYSDKTAVSLNVLGLSPVDKLSHLSFLASSLSGFDSIVSIDQIEAAAALTDELLLKKTLSDFDERIQKSGRLMPLAHFPGVIAISREWTINRELAFDWGIQLWSIQKR